MKKLMTLCIFAFAMMVGTQTSFGQSIVQINALASTHSKELKKAVKFNNDTEEQVYKTYQAFEQKKVEFEKTREAGGTISIDEQKKFDTFLNDSFKTIFTAEEYDRYQVYLDKIK